MSRHVEAPRLRKHISFSQLSLAAMCGEAYRRKYMAGDPSFTTNVPALVGGAFHAAAESFELENAERAGVVPWWAMNTAENTERMIALTKDFIREDIKVHEMDEADLAYYGKQDLEFYRRSRIPDMAASYIKWRGYEVTDLGVRWPDIPKFTELICRAPVGETEVLAVIDQVFLDGKDRTVIRDLKTGKSKPTDAVQLELYRYALKRDYGIEADYGQVLYVGRREPHIQLVTWSMDDEDVATMIQRLSRSTEDMIVNGPFTGHCTICDFREDCTWGGIGTRGSS